MVKRRNRSRKRENEIQDPIPTTAATASSSPAPPPPWIELPGDVMANILQRLDTEEILRSAQKVCLTWRKVCHNPTMWRVVYLKNRRDKDDLEFDLMCRCAVDRSQGQLIDLTIACFGNNDLLTYVADRSSNLRRLTLADPCYISGLALDEGVKKLPQLEELHLIMMPEIYANNVETIGISCPMLKSFTFCEHMNNYECYPDDEYGLAIGKTMPNLRLLRLITISINNEGLEAILNGCRHLESLDLRQCFGLDLQGALGERCSKQIKDLRLPYDSIRDIEWPVKQRDVGWDWDDYDYVYHEYDCDEGYYF